MVSFIFFLPFYHKSCVFIKRKSVIFLVIGVTFYIDVQMRTRLWHHE
jgi:hypothetical protein